MAYYFSSWNDYNVYKVGAVMEEKKTSEAQERANKKWAENNKAYSSYLKSRSSARSFIKNKATMEDLAEFLKLIADRRQELENN